MTVYRCGTGLSSLPGLKRSICTGHDIVVWDHTRSRAPEAIPDGKIETGVHTLRQVIRNWLQTGLRRSARFRSTWKWQGKIV